MYVVMLNMSINQFFVVEWENVMLWGDIGFSVNFQIWYDCNVVLFLFVYGLMSFNDIFIVVGFENVLGIVGYIYVVQLIFGIVGFLFVEGDEFGIVIIFGDQIIVSYSGLVKLLGELMDDMFLVDEDVFIIVNILVNEMEDIIFNIFEMELLLGDFRMYMFIEVDREELDLLMLEVVVEV